RLLRPVAVGQLLEHLGLAAGQQQARALDVAQLPALVDDPGLLDHRRVQPLAEGQAVDQQGRRNGGVGRRRGVFLGVAAQRLQALLLLAQRALAFGHVAGGAVLALLHDLEQRIEPLRAHSGQSSTDGSGSDARAAGAGASSSRAARAARLEATSAASATSWPRKAWIAGQRATASSTSGSLPRW